MKIKFNIKRNKNPMNQLFEDKSRRYFDAAFSLRTYTASAEVFDTILITSDVYRLGVYVKCINLFIVFV
jgi:hypothetical protein